MKGMLLLLALLVTGELGFQTTEACIPFFEAFGAMAIGNKQIMNAVLTKFDATDGERKGFEKIQECYNEGGLKAKFLDSTVLKTITLSPQCRKYYTIDTIEKIKALLSKFNIPGQR
ncbi:androgen-binding protein homolog [Alexandromys fortis]|uniref:androgen-binding protein homolog n=1 Tax=Alexandromys fortis TaxID=100897 RepID=UPI002152FD21|nr:androgen-binding protein homolog [Microtus fortis]